METEHLPTGPPRLSLKPDLPEMSGFSLTYENFVSVLTFHLDSRDSCP
jgi:hypothetical protein